jgi:hypothetical protein
MQQRMTEPNLDHGEVMMLCFEKDSLARYRPLIFLGPPNAPDRATNIYIGTWSVGLRKAQKKGIALYFATYLERYGFKHPEDPTRTVKDGALPASVMTFKQGDYYQASHTYDLDEVPNVAG